MARLHAHASFDCNGELIISVDVFFSTETVFDDVFVVGFAGVHGSDEEAAIRIVHDSEWLGIYRNTDAGARESVDEASNTLTLDPGEQATLGFTVTTSADSPASLSEKVTYTMEIPDAESGTGGGNGGNGDSGSGGSGGDAGGNLVQGAAVVVTPGQVTAVAPAMGTAQMQAVLVTVVPT